MKAALSVFVLTAVLLCGMSQVCYAQLTRSPFPLDYRLEPVGEPFHVGVNTVKFWIISTWKNEVIQIRTTTFGGLEYFGDEVFNFDVDIEERREFVFDILIPDNDTCGIRLDIYGDGGKYQINLCRKCFVTTSDTVGVYRSKPRARTPRPPDVGLPDSINPEVIQEKKIRAVSDSIRQGLRPPIRAEFTILEGSFDDDDLRRELEKYPLTSAKSQTKTFNGKTFIRYEGEMEFHALDWETQDQLHQSAQARNERKQKARIDIIVDLRKAADYDYVKSLGYSLEPVESEPGFYRTQMTKKEIKSLLDRGIDSARYPDLPGERSPLPPDTVRNTHDGVIDGDTESYSPDPQGWYSIIETSFETGIAPMGALDLNSDNGYDYWGASSQLASTGEYSAWCSEYGDRPESYNYDYNMDAWLHYGVSGVSDFTTMTIEYETWYDIEEDPDNIYDFCCLYISYDGNYWTSVMDMSDIYYGYSDGWLYDERFEIDISGHDTVFFAFRFVSDESYNFSGIFIDSLQVFAYKEGHPDLVANEPDDWYAPIVPSHDVGSTWPDDDLWAYKTTYLDFSIQNVGDETAYNVMFEVFCDDLKIFTLFGDSLPPGSYGIVCDLEHIFTDGFHHLEMFIDPANTITEWSESNNYYSTTLEWAIPYVSINGLVQYQDLGNYAAPMPARNIIIEAWDLSFGETPDQLLKTDTADDNGIFELSEIPNFNSKDTTNIDLYLKIFASNNVAYTYNNLTPADSVYFYRTSTRYNISPGVIDTTILLPEDDSGPFFIIDQMKNARDKWESVQKNKSMTRVKIRLCDSITGYWVSQNTILVDTSDNDLSYSPDTFDGDILIEEYGHKIERDFQFFDLSNYEVHHWFMRYDKSWASCEAFTYFWSCLTRGTNRKYNYFDNFTKYVYVDLENGEFYYNTDRGGSVVDSGGLDGGLVEGNAACILWDLYDNANDDQNGDGYGDDVSISATDMLEVLSAYHADNIFEFLSDWVDHGRGYNRGMWQAFYEQRHNVDSVPPSGEMLINCGATSTDSLLVDLELNMYDSLSGLAYMAFSNNGSTYSSWEPYSTEKFDWDLTSYGGNEDMGVKTVHVMVTDSAGDAPYFGPPAYYTTADIEYMPPYVCGDANGDGLANVGDVVYLINYCFKFGPPPVPMEAGDANCDGAVNVGDAVYLKTYVFQAGPPPCCP